MGFHYWCRTVKENRRLVNRKKTHAFNKKAVKDGYPKKEIRFKSISERILHKNRLRIQAEIAEHKRRHKIILWGSLFLGLVIFIERFGHLFAMLFV